jgi:hypothetical protein
MNRIALLLWITLGVVGCAGTHRLNSDPTLKEARRGIEEGYRRNRKAFLAKDVKPIMALRTDDFSTIGPDGKLVDRAGMETYTVGLLHGIQRWIEIDFKVHRVETWATQRERWRLTPDGWKLAKVDQVRDQKRLVDGAPG